MGAEAIRTDEQVIMGAVMRRVVVDKFRPYLSKRSKINPLADFVKEGDLEDIIDGCEREVRLVLGKYAKGAIGTFDFRSIMEPEIRRLAKKYPSVIGLRDAFVDEINGIAEDVRRVLRGELEGMDIDPVLLNLIDLARGRIESLRNSQGGDVVLERESDKVLVNGPSLGMNTITRANGVDELSIGAGNGRNEYVHRIQSSFGDKSVKFDLVRPDGVGIFDDPVLRELFGACFDGQFEGILLEIFNLLQRESSTAWWTRDGIADGTGKSYAGVVAAMRSLRSKGIRIVTDEAMIGAPGFYVLERPSSGRTRELTIVYAKPDFAL